MRFIIILIFISSISIFSITATFMHDFAIRQVELIFCQGFLISIFYVMNVNLNLFTIFLLSIIILLILIRLFFGLFILCLVCSIMDDLRVLDLNIMIWVGTSLAKIYLCWEVVFCLHQIQEFILWIFYAIEHQKTTYPFFIYPIWINFRVVWYSIWVKGHSNPSYF